MQLVTYASPKPQLGFLCHGQVFNLADQWVAAGYSPMPTEFTMIDLISNWNNLSTGLDRCWQRVETGDVPAGIPVESTSLLAPIPRPTRNPFAIAGNYAQHVANSEAKVGQPLRERKTPVFFTKTTNTVIGPYEPIEFDPGLTQQVDYELELGVIIGQRGRDIAEAEAMDYVFGYTVVNDISARDLQLTKPTVNYLRGKGLDTFFPMGPAVVPRAYLPDYRTCVMRLYVNEELRQSATPAQMMRDIPEIIAELSRGLTLEPGDIIATGTPAGCALEMAEPRYLQHGDVVRSEIEGIGAMVNPVRAQIKEVSQ